MKILAFGCIHGKWAVVSRLIDEHKPDLCILTGDLHTFRNEVEMLASIRIEKY